MLPILYRRNPNDKRLFHLIQYTIHHDIEWLERDSEKNLKDAIHVFHIYLKAKSTVKYDVNFENYLYNELTWLDQKIVSDLDSMTKERVIRYGKVYRNYGLSLYYWDDIMRKTLIHK